MTDFQFPIEAGHIMMFARAVGDDNPIYSDSEFAGSTAFDRIIAPPTFVQAAAQFNPDYPLRPRVGHPWFGSGRTSTDTSVQSSGTPVSRRGGGLHAEQHFDYHRPLLAGDVLRVTSQPGRSWNKQGRRGGSLTFAESITEYRDPDGLLVVTTRGVSVKTDRPVERGR